MLKSASNTTDLFIRAQINDCYDAPSSFAFGSSMSATCPHLDLNVEMRVGAPHIHLIFVACVMIDADGSSSDGLTC